MSEIVRRPSEVGSNSTGSEGISVLRAQLDSLGVAMIPKTVQQIISALGLAETNRDAYHVFDGAREYIQEMVQLGRTSRWIGEFGFKVATQADAERMGENLQRCRELQITCAPRIHEIIPILDGTAVIVLMFAGGAGVSPRAVTSNDVISAEVGEKFLDNISRLGKAGYINSVSSNRAHWLFHPASGDIVLENWITLEEAANDDVAAVLADIRASL